MLKIWIASQGFKEQFRDQRASLDDLLTTRLAAFMEEKGVRENEEVFASQSKLQLKASRVELDSNVETICRVDMES